MDSMTTSTGVRTLAKRASAARDLTLFVGLFGRTEMIFGRLNSFYWSRDQTNLHLCYISINNSLMPLESMTLYPEDKDSVQRSYRYPNVGARWLLTR